MGTHTHGGALLAVILGLALGPAAVAHAQSWSPPPDSERMAFTFLGDRLEVRVLDVAEGELRLVRGDRGTLRVTAHAPDGIPGIGRVGNGTERLALTAAGSDRAVFLVVVPAHVRVRVLLPYQELRESFDPPHGTAVFRWPDAEAEAGPGAEPDPEAEPGAEPDA